MTTKPPERNGRGPEAVGSAMTMTAATECPIDSIQTAIVVQPRDWGLDHRDAWIYGIAVGWGNAMDDVARRHGWTTETVERLRRLHDRFRSMAMVQMDVGDTECPSCAGVGELTPDDPPGPERLMMISKGTGMVIGDDGTPRQAVKGERLGGACPDCNGTGRRGSGAPRGRPRL